MSHNQNTEQSTHEPLELPWRSCGGFDERYSGSTPLDVRSVSVVERCEENWRRRRRGQQVGMVMFRG